VFGQEGRIGIRTGEGSGGQVAFPQHLVTSALASFWSGGQRIERAAYVVGALLLISGLIHLAILLISRGSWQGLLSLRKPMTFGLSFGLTLITIVWVASFLRLSHRGRMILLGAFTGACALETALVTLQAWRGVPSHFNIETVFDALVARTLAAGGIVLVAVIVVLAFAAFRTNPTVPVSLRIAIQIGFVALVGAVGVGAWMIAKGMALVYAGNPQAAYATGGALKPTHAATMHAILVLPALAWLLSFTNWSERRRVVVVLVAAAGFLVLAGVVVVGNVIGLALVDEHPRSSPEPVGVLTVGAEIPVDGPLGRKAPTHLRQSFANPVCRDGPVARDNLGSGGRIEAKPGEILERNTSIGGGEANSEAKTWGRSRNESRTWRRRCFFAFFIADRRSGCSPTTLVRSHDGDILSSGCACALVDRAPDA
jgi:hypothetical protein